MKEIRLIRLSMRDFKGCASRTFDFDGRDAAIYGANGTGKSTVYDALTWLLFDKVANDDGTVQSAPDIKPNGEDGQVRDHSAVTSVEASFSVDGTTVTLRREFHEVWAQKRGSDQKVMTGHTNEHLWNEVPVQLQEFKSRLGEQFLPEDLFWTLSNVHWFCRGMDWKKRRELLTEVCGLPDDRTIMDADPERFGGLSESMAGRSLGDYRTWVDAQIRKLNGAQKTYPARMDEVLRTVDTYSVIDFAALRSRRELMEAQIRQRTDELSRLENGTLLSGRRNDLQSLRLQMRDLDLRNAQHRREQSVPVEDRRPALEQELARWRASLARAEGQEAAERRTAASIEARIASLREDYRKEGAATFSEAVCPTCGQTLPPDAQADARTKFEADRALRQRRLCEEAQREKERLAESGARLEAAQTAAEEARERVAALTEELGQYVVPDAPVIADLPGYAEDMASFRERIAALEREVAGLERQDAASRESIGRELAQLR